MDFEELLNKRRSVREFDENYLITESEILKIIQAGILVPAPSGKLPLKIYEFSSFDSRRKLEEEITQGKESLLQKAEGKQKSIIAYYWRYTHYLFKAPLILALGADEGVKSLLHGDASSDNELTLGLSLFSMSLMAENLKLSSTILRAPLYFSPEVLGLKIKAFMAIGKAKDNILLGLKEERNPLDYRLKI